MYLLLCTEINHDETCFYPIKVSKDKNKIEELLKNAEEFEENTNKILKKEDFGSERRFYYSDDKCTYTQYSIEYVPEI